ncbi:hypothetical protein ACTHAM_002044 [Cellulomonas soli]|uniref:hypothetical protein n=1 Tax=Cellulomonas soli TaxID=931535 RepID=UPI003F83E417
MFSLLVGLNDGTVQAARLLEYTDDAVKTRLGRDYAASLSMLPALAMPEIGDDRFEQVAQVGTITAMHRIGSDYRFTFVPNPNLSPIPLAVIQEMAASLGVDPGSWEFKRTHWAVKDVDVFQVLLEYDAGPGSAGSGGPRPPRAVRFPTELPRDLSLVAVMMPFSPQFDVVYETIEMAVNDAGLVCARADNIWEHDHVMGDVLSLLWRSRIVIADLTGKNANVFYEAGLAHALPRPTVLVTQNADDVPFDLQSIRYLKYGLGTTARSEFRQKLSERLKTLA